MKAEVIHFNSESGYYSATTEQNKVVFTLLEPAVLKIGDILEGGIESCGVRLLHTECLQLKVYFFTHVGIQVFLLLRRSKVCQCRGSEAVAF